MPTAREETSRLADLLRREHHALAEFLIALAEFDRERRWVQLGYASLFDFSGCASRSRSEAARRGRTAQRRSSPPTPHVGSRAAHAARRGSGRLSHSHPGAPDDASIKVGLRLVIERHRKRRGIGAKPRKTAEETPKIETAPFKVPPPPPGRSRYVPREVWRQVWERDGGRCAFPLENGGVCGSMHKLELDHIEGFALGAGTTAKECRIACDFHNDLNARDLYGDDLMNRYTRPKRGPRCSEQVSSWLAPPALHVPGPPGRQVPTVVLPPSRSAAFGRRRARWAARTRARYWPV
jgi:hypothetical protein